MLLLLVVGTATRAAEAGTGEGSTESIRQFDHWGFSIAPEPINVGDELALVFILNPGTTWVPIPMYFRSNEYTVYTHGLVLRSRISNGPFIQSTYDGGIADIYRDPSFNAPFKYNTPASQVPPLNPDLVPATFMDGELIVRFKINRLTTLFYPPAGIGTVAYTDSDLHVVDGSALRLLDDLHMLTGWHMGGGYTDEPGTVPDGYGYRYDTLFRWESPLAVEPVTWGKIKARFN
jgi:hypothetical protein